MQALIKLTEKHLGPKASAATAAVFTAVSQAQSKVDSLAEAGVTTSITEVVSHALQNPTVATMLPAPLAAVAAFAIRKAPANETPKPPPVTEIVDITKKQLDTKSDYLQGHIEETRKETTTRLNSLEEHVKLAVSDFNKMVREVEALKQKTQKAIDQKGHMKDNFYVLYERIEQAKEEMEVNISGINEQISDNANRIAKLERNSTNYETLVTELTVPLGKSETQPTEQPNNIRTTNYKPKFGWSEESIDNLKNVHPDLIELANRICDRYDIKIISGYRTLAEQKELHDTGAGIAPGKSKHNAMPSQAFDFCPIPVNFNNIDAYLKVMDIASQEAKLMGIKIVRGGDWKRRDYGHIELA